MDAIIKVVSDAGKEIKIMSDCAAYGHFSAPDKSEEYLQALIKNRRAGKVVTLVIYDSKAGGEAREAQWKEAETDFARIIQKNQRKFHDFFVVHHPTSKGIPKEYKGFVEALANNEQERRDQMLKNGLELHVVNELHDLPFFLWLRDNHEAILSFYNFGDVVREISFRTTDGHLISALNDVFERTKTISRRETLSLATGK
jgi:hypothetical protein